MGGLPAVFTPAIFISCWPVRVTLGPVGFRISIDGAPPGADHGVDVDAAGRGSVREDGLYQLVRQTRPVVDRTFEIEFVDAGVRAYAFTFG